MTGGILGKNLIIPIFLEKAINKNVCSWYQLSSPNFYDSSLQTLEFISSSHFPFSKMNFYVSTKYRRHMSKHNITNFHHFTIVFFLQELMTYAGLAKKS